MTRPFPLVATLTLAAIAVGTLTRSAAQVPQSFTLDQVLSYPFPEHLIASPVGSMIAWTFNEQGVRNIYVAEGPDFTPRRLTNYDADDGRDLTSLSFSDDGRYLVYVRGGNRDKSKSAPGNLAADPADRPVRPSKQVWSIRSAGGDMKLLGDGDSPAIAPRSHRVAFVKDGRIWIAPIDGSKPAESVYVRGTSEAPTWSPNGDVLAFASNRDDHGFIALFAGMDQAIRYMAPSTSRDSSPVWSPDGKQIAFVRQPGRIDEPFPPVTAQRARWAIWVGDAASGSAREAWKSGRMVIDALPTVEGGANLRWGAADRLVFLSYQDGWPHLYSVSALGGPPMLLTPGPLMVEHVSMSPDRSSVFYSANGGSDRDDLDRRHIFRVLVHAAQPTQLTSGLGIEWSPVLTGDQQTLAYLASDALRVPLPTIQPLDSRQARTLAEDLVPVDFPLSKLVTPQGIIIRAPDATEVHGQLFKANDGDAPRPALLFVHGGPERQMLLGWHSSYDHANAYALNQYLASRGFLVLSVNYRLGIGYGHAFHHPDRGNAAASEHSDLLAAAKYLQTRPDVDPKRIGIWGGSYGGYLTALALARSSEAFAVGVDIDGPPDLVLAEFRKLYAPEVDDAGEIVSSPTWTSSPFLIIRGHDDRTERFRQIGELEQQLIEQRLPVEVRVIPEGASDLLLVFRSWKTAAATAADYFERRLLNRGAR